MEWLNTYKSILTFSLTLQAPLHVTRVKQDLTMRSKAGVQVHGEHTGESTLSLVLFHQFVTKSSANMRAVFRLPQNSTTNFTEMF